ncbi:hydrophobin [Mycena belliarum]|uniref:Hydrophobin n=1 Tax=Mycena belliarum TaxID=1033014 RepID=A0AAD6XN77_9AGAR|nr:hydrophobin [Mycena belliae]
MLFRISRSIVVASVLAAGALAAPQDVAARSGAAACNTGSLKCCNSIQSASSGPVGLLLGLLGIVLPAAEANANVGLTCSPITVLGILPSGSKCTQQTACCTGNTYNGGLVNVDCNNISL